MQKRTFQPDAADAPAAPDATDEPVAAWPPSPLQRAHLERLAALIRRFGPERFVDARVVRADERDFPEPWEPSAAAVHRLLYRLAWHAYVDARIELVDARPARVPEHRMLTTTELEFASVDAGRATFELAAIGNDDVAGLLAHRVGALFLESAPGDPFRATAAAPDDADASVAAVYLGLGVLVANSSMYRRHASRLAGKTVFSEQHVARAGGLALADATFLLAVQDAVRDDHQDALDTLLPPQQEWLARWRDALEPHEDELRALLGLDDEHPPRALVRAAAPTVPAALPERDLTRFNRGRTTFRVAQRPWHVALGGALGGMLATALAGLAMPWILGAVVGGGVVGRVLTRRTFQCADPQCAALMASELRECPRCGGAIADTIAHANDRLERLEQLEAARGDAPDARAE